MNGPRNKMLLLAAVAAFVVCGPFVQKWMRDTDPRPAIQRPPAQPTDFSGLYSGPWVCTKGKSINGTMQCAVQSIGRPENQFYGSQDYDAHFTGIWQGMPIDYKVHFVVANNTLKSAHDTIDGASYDWYGDIDGRQFDVVFTGNRYDGHFELSRVR